MTYNCVILCSSKKNYKYFFECTITGFIGRLSFDSFTISHPEVFSKKGVIENFDKFTGKHLRWSPFLIKFLLIIPMTSTFCKKYKKSIYRACLNVFFGSNGRIHVYNNVWCANTKPFHWKKSYQFYRKTWWFTVMQTTETQWS